MSEVEFIFYHLAVASMFIILALIFMSCIFIWVYIPYLAFEVLKELRRKSMEGKGREGRRGRGSEGGRRGG